MSSTGNAKDPDGSETTGVVATACGSSCRLLLIIGAEALTSHTSEHIKLQGIAYENACPTTQVAVRHVGQ